MITATLFATGILVSAIGTLLMKVGADRLPGFSLSWEYALAIAKSPHIVTGLMLYVIPAFLWIYLLGKFPVSIVQPVIALTYVITPLMAMFVLGEMVPGLRWVGITLIVAGVTIVGFTHQS
jgi:drug/metabolite transporter (DMT)-like permease